MKVTFTFPRPKAYDSQFVRQFPSGGTEKAVIFLGEAFEKLGHSVTWLTTVEQVEQYQGDEDVYITQVAKLLEQAKGKRVWWCHHFPDQPIIQDNACYGRVFADKVVTLSQCHHESFKEQLKIDSVVIGHGVWLDEVVTGVNKDPYRLIYASTPFRGLERLPELFTAIKAREPRATIAVCSSMETYGEPEKDAQYREIFEELQALEGVKLLGALKQEALYREYAKASIFFYPCTWAETYCLALDEALAHGCKPIVSDLGALPERVNPEWINGDIRIKSLGEILIDKALRKEISIKFKPIDWLTIAKQWEEEVLK